LGFKFRRQRSIGRAVTDFTCESAKVVVELDGGQHEAETDAPRTARLSEAGYLVIRFWNNDVLQNLDGVLEAIAQTLGLGTDADGPPLP
jgi:very-short-patch-repair endonuclease